jgi:hypothetical protein
VKSIKLIKLLKAFNKKEFKELGDFVESPYFNKLQNVVKLYNYLSKFYPGFQNKNFTKENAFAKIFPGQKYDDGRLRALISHLFSLAEKFLAFNKYSKNELNIRLDISHELRRIGNGKLLNENIFEMDKVLSEYKCRDEMFYYNLYRIFYEKNTVANYFLSEKRFDEEANNLILYSIITFLKIYTTGLNSLKSVNIKLDLELADDIIAIINKEPFKNNPAIKMQYTLYNLLKFDDEKYFFEHLNLMNEYPNILGQEETYETFIVLLNFCVIRIQKGFPEFALHKFNLYKTMLEKNVPMLEHNYFSYAFFNNIVTSALEMKEYDWAEKFIEEYKNRLDERYKNDVVNLCYAKVNYFLKDYERALNYLSKCGNNENVYYKLALKDLQIKVFFELGHYESIFSIIDSYKHFFHKNKLIVKEVKERYKIFLKNLNQFLKLVTKNNKEDLILFKQKLNSAPSFLHKNWILEKIN